MGGLAGRKEKEGIIILKIKRNIFLKATFQPLRIHSLKAERDCVLETHSEWGLCQTMD